jgi:hypothetical protein
MSPKKKKHFCNFRWVGVGSSLLWGRVCFYKDKCNFLRRCRCQVWFYLISFLPSFLTSSSLSRCYHLPVPGTTTMILQVLSNFLFAISYGVAWRLPKGIKTIAKPTFAITSRPFVNRVSHTKKISFLSS